MHTICFAPSHMVVISKKTGSVPRMVRRYPYIRNLNPFHGSIAESEGATGRLPHAACALAGGLADVSRLSDFMDRIPNSDPT